MHDGGTRKLAASEPDDDFEQFQERWKCSLVIVEGGAYGTEFLLDQPQCSLGRGPGVDLAFEDDAMSREHAMIEFTSGGFRVRDLRSTNGTHLNSGEISVAELEHGDRLQLGGHVFQLVLEERKREPRMYVLPEE